MLSIHSKASKGQATFVTVPAADQIGLIRSNKNIRAEKEADVVANRLGQIGKPREIQRKVSDEEEEQVNLKPISRSSIPFGRTQNDGSVSAEISQQIQTTQSHGYHLNGETKSFMESRFSTDFSAVKIHTGNYAVQSSEALGAKAFTVGNDIYFNHNKFSPTSRAGIHLLAHELTHTLQQKGRARKIQKEEKDKDPTYAPKPEIDFNLLMPEFQLKLYHFLLEADTSKVHLDYQTRNFMAGLSYQYGDALSLNLKFRDFKTKLGWTPGDNLFSLGLNQGNFGAKFSTTPGQSKYGLGLTYGVQLPTMEKMNATFIAGGNSAAQMAMGIPGSFDDPIAYYQQHKEDIENLSKTADMIKQITKAGESKIKFGGDISVTYDPVSKLVIGGRFGIMF